MDNLSQKYMKFPSVHTVVKGASRTFLRFPLAITLAVIATVFCILLVRLPYEGFGGPKSHFWYKNVVAATYLGVMLSIALTVMAEKRRLGRGVRMGLQGAVAVLVWVYYFLQPDHFTVQALIRFVLYTLGLHWLIACIAFSGRENNGFWIFNKRLFLHILTSILYTLVLYLGLMLALLAVENLFNVHVDGKLYAYIWWVLAGIFNTWFFLSGFPAGYENPVVIADYPRGLKIFTQFVLLPILTVYLLILYAYLFRIVFTATWPFGWVTYLVLGFSVAGILAILLVWPLREEENNKWISGYSRFFYFALFPLIILLFIAILKRVGAYGITELRYFVLLLAAWLLFVAVYFLVSKRKNIQLIPLSLCVAAFLVSFGPWGSAGVSSYSQMQRLKGLLVKNKLFADGKVIGGTAGKVTGGTAWISLDDRKEITGITGYIVEMHGYKVLRPWFRQNLDSLMKGSTGQGYRDRDTAGRDPIDVLLTAMNVQRADNWTVEDNGGEPFYINSNGHETIAIPVKGYDYLVDPLDISVTDTADARFQIDKYPLRIHLDSARSRLDLFLDADSALTIDLSAATAETMTFDAGNGGWASRLVLQHFNGVKRDGKNHITNLGGYLLMKKK